MYRHWERLSTQAYTVWMSCHNCFKQWEDTVDATTFEAFDHQTEQQTQTILTDYQTLKKARVEKDIAEFARALLAGDITPESF